MYSGTVSKNINASSDANATIRPLQPQDRRRIKGVAGTAPQQNQAMCSNLFWYKQKRRLSMEKFSKKGNHQYKGWGKLDGPTAFSLPDTPCERIQVIQIGVLSRPFHDVYLESLPPRAPCVLG